MPLMFMSKCLSACYAVRQLNFINIDEIFDELIHLEEQQGGPGPQRKCSVLKQNY